MDTYAKAVGEYKAYQIIEQGNTKTCRKMRIMMTKPAKVLPKRVFALEEKDLAVEADENHKNSGR